MHRAASVLRLHNRALHAAGAPLSKMGTSHTQDLRCEDGGDRVAHNDLMLSVDITMHQELRLVGRYRSHWFVIEGIENG
jgi:hypothetical protein